MSLRAGLAGVAALVLPLGVAFAQTADPEPSDPAALRQELDAQKQRLLILERKLEIQEEASKDAAKAAPVVKASNGHFSFGSPDGANVIKLKGTFHFDYRRFDDDITSQTADTFIARRIRPTLEGTVFNIYDFRLMPDFASGKSVIVDAFVAARFHPWSVVTAGKFKVPVGLERIQSASDLRFIERGLPTDLVPNRDLGVQLSGDVKGGVFSYSIGYFNGTTDGNSSDSNTSNGVATADVDNDSKGDWAGRVFFQPFLTSDNFALRGLGLGVAGTYTNATGTPTTSVLTGYKTPGQQTFFNWRTSALATATTPATNFGTYAAGERTRLSPQVYYYYGPFGLLGEYVDTSQEVTRLLPGTGRRSDKLGIDAWQVQFSYFLTREEEAFKGFTPGSTYEPGKPGAGAWELVARVHQLKIDSDAFEGGGDSFANPSTAARKASAWGVGVNWYLNSDVKVSLDYDQTSFDGGAANGGDRPDEKAIFTRLGVAF